MKQTRPGAGIGDVGDVGGHMSANVDVGDVGADVEVDVVAVGVADAVHAAAAVADVVVALADSTLNASVNASAGAAGETILRCPWRPRVIVAVARQREADSGSER